MNRAIKFRVWDKTKGAWYDKPFTLREAMARYWVHEDPLADLIFMQFTGLLDKNGKEIYEGDILKEADDETLWFVEWEDGRYWFVNTSNHLNRNSYDWLSEQGYWGKPEVIGNIYENPDLLKP